MTEEEERKEEQRETKHGGVAGTGSYVVSIDYALPISYAVAIELSQVTGKELRACL